MQYAGWSEVAKRCLSTTVYFRPTTRQASRGCKSEGRRSTASSDLEDDAGVGEDDSGHGGGPGDHKQQVDEAAVHPPLRQVVHRAPRQHTLPPVRGRQRNISPLLCKSLSSYRDSEE